MIIIIVLVIMIFSLISCACSCVCSVCLAGLFSCLELLPTQQVYIQKLIITSYYHYIHTTLLDSVAIYTLDKFSFKLKYFV